MKKKRSFIIGFILGALIFGGVAYAATMIEVHFVPLKYYYNGFELKPARGKEGFIYEGRTYVPLRFVSENLEKDVAWDGDTYRIDITDAEKLSQNIESEKFQQLYSKMAFDEDYLYFYESGSDTIFRWQKDSTEKEIFLTNVSGMLAVNDEWVYFSVTQNPASLVEDLYRIRTDGTNQEKITTDENIEWVYVTDDWIYMHDARFHTSNLAKQRYPYSLESTIDASKLNGGYSYQPLYVIDNWMYCIRTADTFQTRKTPQVPIRIDDLVKINLNNFSEIETVLQHEKINSGAFSNYEPIDAYDYLDNRVYSSSAFVGVVNELDLATGELKEIEALSSTTILEFDVNGEWIFYEDANNGNLYKSKLDGTQKMMLLEAEDNLCFYGGIKVLDEKIYFVRLVDDVKNDGKSVWQYGSITTNGKTLKIAE